MKSSVVLLAVVAGCNFADSNQVATGELRSDIQVVADGSGSAEVFAWLWTHKAGDPPLNEDSIRLVDGDSLAATSSGHSIAMTETDLVVEYRYDATFDSAAADQEFDVELERGGDTLESTATLPPPFTLSAPSQLSRGQPETITWTPGNASDQITVTIDGTCAEATIGPVADTGSLTLAPGTVTLASPGPTTCAITIALTRSRTGTLDPAFGQGGSIIAEQQRMTTSTSAP